MQINSMTSVGEIVEENFRTAAVFDRNKIDFCCGGGISLREACTRAGVELDEILEELEPMLITNDPDSRYISSLEPDELCDYIEKRHHTYVNENLPFLSEKLEKLCSVHGEGHPELFKVKELFELSAGNLAMHMKKEELILFPYIRKMVATHRSDKVSSDEFGDVAGTLDLMEKEHEAEGGRFVEIAKLTSGYNCPPDGCNTYRVTYRTLKEFEEDLHRHIHLENNILFKKALALEEQLIR